MVKQAKKYGYYDSDLNLVENVKEPENGKKIISTIDVNVQGVLEQHMQKFQTDTGSKNMGVIIMIQTMEKYMRWHHHPGMT